MAITSLQLGNPLARNLARAWRWWIGELAGLLPTAMRSAILPGARYWFLEPQAGELVIQEGTLQDAQEVGRYPLGVEDATPLAAPRGIREVLLYLPEDRVLAKTLSLPLAATENLREVLAFEMDRHTPFSAEQVYYDYRVLETDTAEHVLKLQLVLTPRHVLDDLLDALEPHGLRPDVVTMRASASGGRVAVNLLPVERRPRKPLATRRLNQALAGLAALLLVAALALPLLQKQHVIRSMEPLLQEAQVKADTARGMRENIDQLVVASHFMVNKKQKTATVLALINEVTRLLPDHTWLSRMEINGNEIQLQGQSAAAAGLLPLIEGSEHLENARFRSPVTQIRTTDSERFHLSAAIRHMESP